MIYYTTPKYVGGNRMAKNQGHPAAAILREIAEVAEWHPEPWRDFQRYFDLGSQWKDCESFASFAYALENSINLRRKPRTKRIGNYDVPLPEREAPEIGTQYSVACPEGTDYYFIAVWDGSIRDYLLLSRDLIHLDPKSAETHGRALASLMQEGVE